MVVFGTINEAMFDWPWSGIHFLSGAIVGSALLALAWTKPARRYWLIGVTILILWECTEGSLRWLDHHAHEAVAPLKNVLQGFAFAPESTANILGDILIGSAGLLFSRTIISTVKNIFAAGPRFEQ